MPSKQEPRLMLLAALICVCILLVNTDQTTDSSHEPEEATVTLNFEITTPIREQGVFGPDLVPSLYCVLLEIFVRMCFSSRCLFSTPV